VLIADLVFTANLELLVSNLLFLDDYFDYWPLLLFFD
jgi:hypothetical protein